MTVAGLIERSSTQRPSSFWSVRLYEDVTPALGFKPSAHGETPEWLRLRALWCKLPAHPNLLEAIAPGPFECVLLRYPALDYQVGPPALGDSPRHVSHDGFVFDDEQLIAWGAQITEAFAEILDTVPASEQSQLLRPFVMLDVGGHSRLGFVPVVLRDPAIVSALPPECASDLAACDERSFIHVIGATLRAFSSLLTHGSAIIDQCVAPDPRARFKNLAALRRAWRKAGARDVVRRRSDLEAWRLAEQGRGWLDLRDGEAATTAFQRAREIAPCELADAGLEAASKLSRERTAQLTLPAVSVIHFQPRQAATRRHPARAWSEVRATGEQLESQRAFREALALYHEVALGTLDDAAVHVAIARCQLALGAAAMAIEHAQRALTAGATDFPARSIATRACLLAGRPDDALRAAAAWREQRPADPAAWYAEGRALLALRRLDAARDAFDRALALDPRMIEAMLLRREADRAMRGIRAAVGTQPMPAELDLPEHLSELRAAHAAGDVDEMVRILERPAHAADALAKLLHARCLMFVHRFEEAAAMFDHARRLSPEHAHAALVGKADALLARGNLTDALALYDQALAETPADRDALDGHARTLRQLGRAPEAEAELRQARLL